MYSYFNIYAITTHLSITKRDTIEIVNNTTIKVFSTVRVSYELLHIHLWHHKMCRMPILSFLSHPVDGDITNKGSRKVGWNRNYKRGQSYPVAVI
jgi:hypothetical protein